MINNDSISRESGQVNLKIQQAMLWKILKSDI